MTEVEIVNAALSLIGEDPITALTDTSNRAVLANRIYSLERDAVLRAHGWNFALKRAALTVDATAPAWGFDYRYPLPTDPTDLISNGGFDSDASDWTAVSSSIASTAGGQSGNCLTMTSDAADGVDAAYQDITTVSGTMYQLDGYVKSGTSGDESFVFSINNSTGTYIRAMVRGASSSTWMKYTVYWIADETTMRVYIYKNTNTAGTMLFDTVSVIARGDVYCLRVLEMEDDVIYGEDWRIEGRYIFTNESTCNIRYIARITDTSEFEPLFIEALMYRLASTLAKPLAGDKALAENMFKIYQLKLMEARGINLNEKYQVAVDHNPLAWVR